MDPEHASITGRLFFSRVEKNQKAQRRGETLYGEGVLAAAERQNSLRSDTAAPRRRSSAATSPAFLRAPSHPDENGELKLAHRTTFGKPEGEETSLKLGAGTKILPA